jgi:hypothetical protein
MFPEYAWADYNLEVDISRLLYEIKQVNLRALYVTAALYSNTMNLLNPTGHVMHQQV